MIKKELEEIRDAYGVPRRTQLMQEDAGAVLPEEEAHVSEEALVVLLPGARAVSYTHLDVYKRQRWL